MATRPYPLRIPEGILQLAELQRWSSQSNPPLAPSKAFCTASCC